MTTDTKPDLRERIAAGEFDTKYEPRETYLQRMSETKARFKVAALREVGIEDHKRADSVFQLAWDYGHSNGHCEVLGFLEDLAELLP